VYLSFVVTFFAKLDFIIDFISSFSRARDPTWIRTAYDDDFSDPIKLL